MPFEFFEFDSRLLKLYHSTQMKIADSFKNSVYIA